MVRFARRWSGSSGAPPRTARRVHERAELGVEVFAADLQAVVVGRPQSQLRAKPIHGRPARIGQRNLMWVRETTRASSTLTIDRGGVGNRLPVLRAATERAYLAFCGADERAQIACSTMSALSARSGSVRSN